MAKHGKSYRKAMKKIEKSIKTHESEEIRYDIQFELSEVDPKFINKENNIKRKAQG